MIFASEPNDDSRQSVCLDDISIEAYLKESKATNILNTMVSDTIGIKQYNLFARIAGKRFFLDTFYYKDLHGSENCNYQSLYADVQVRYDVLHKRLISIIMGRILLIHNIDQVATKQCMIFLDKKLGKHTRYEFAYCISAEDFITLIFHDVEKCLRIDKNSTTFVDSKFVQKISKNVQQSGDIFGQAELCWSDAQSLRILDVRNRKSLHFIENGQISFAVFPEREIRYVTKDGLFSHDGKRFYKLEAVKE